MDLENIQFSISAPGKIILMGEHSVLYNKKGIAAAINKRTYLHFKEHKQANGQITINLKNINGCSEWDFKSVYDLITSNKQLINNQNFDEFNLYTPELLNHDEFVKVLYEFVSKKVNDNGSKQKSIIALYYLIVGMLWCTDVDITPFDLEITTDLTIGAGTGSSASFAVTCAAALYHYIRLKGVQKHGTGEYNISNAMFKSFNMCLAQHYCGFNAFDKDVINKWAYCTEKIMHGTPSGLDNTVCTFGNTVLINTNNPGGKFKMVDDMPPLRVLLINSGIERSCADLVAKPVALRKLCPEAFDSILQSMDTIAFEFIKLLHEMNEQEEIVQMTDIYKKVEVLIDIQHCLLKSLGVSHKRLEEICELCSDYGLHCKLTGAGGGGCAYAIISPSITEDLINKAINVLKKAGFLVDDIVINAEGVALDFKPL